MMHLMNVIKDEARNYLLGNILAIALMVYVWPPETPYLLFPAILLIHMCISWYTNNMAELLGNQDLPGVGCSIISSGMAGYLWHRGFYVHNIRVGFLFEWSYFIGYLYGVILRNGLKKSSREIIYANSLTPLCHTLGFSAMMFLAPILVV